MEKDHINLIEETKEELIIALRMERKPKVVVMPHFCVDALLRYDGDHESFMRDFENIATHGGNIPTMNVLSRGGKAANCASALASIGADVYLIARTNELGYILLEHLLGRNVDLSHVSKEGELASTVAIELKEVNVMLSYAGSLSNFGPDCLTGKDEALIRDAEIVCMSDWALNAMGTELVRHVFHIADGKTFFDPGDSSFRRENEIKDMMTEVLKSGLVDVLSVNEDEIIRYATEISSVDSISDAASILKGMTRVDLHTKDYVSTFSARKDVSVPTFQCQPLRLTGAGDAWDAGDIYGDAIGLDDAQRLMLANAVAAYYISSPQGEHPTRTDLIEFLEETPLE
jgi:sugar/nucleoside kinase (ribokinase family)